MKKKELSKKKIVAEMPLGLKRTLLLLLLVSTAKFGIEAEEIFEKKIVGA
jgi:hypothetical protein